MNSVKRDDCMICAYAEIEGVSWKSAKRRMRKFRASKKELSCQTSLIRRMGLSGYELVKDGSYNSIAQAMRYKKGIILVGWNGTNNGHAVAWNGHSVIDNSVGPLSGMNNESFNCEGVCSIIQIMIKKDTSHFCVLKNHIMCLWHSLFARQQ